MRRLQPTSLLQVLTPLKCSIMMIAMTLLNIVCPDPEEAGKAIVIVPLVALEDQFGDAMERLGIRYLSLTSTSVETLEDQIQELQPLVLLTNVESLNDSGIQRKISKLKLSYIAIDKAQVFCRSMTAAESLLIFTQPTNTFEIRTDLPGGRGTTKSLSKILLKRQKNCQRESLNSLFMVADPFSKKSFCTAVSMMFAPLQSSTLRRRPGRSAVRLACRQKPLSAATASAVMDAVHSAPAPLPSTILIPP